tara:strand:- start:308 stop:523 length:216 start_codon:yes stop_codon:yes gene_type:complete
MASRQAQLMALAEEGNESAIEDLFKEFPELYKKLYGKEKGMRQGGLARGKRSIARGCGKVMEGRRKKTLYT